MQITFKHTYLYLQQTHLSPVKLGDSRSDISGCMVKNRLRFNADKTDIIITGSFRQCRKLSNFSLSPFLILVSHSHAVCNLGVTFYLQKTYFFDMSHLILTMSLPIFCTRWATELDFFRGYCCYRNLLLLLLIISWLAVFIAYPCHCVLFNV